MSEKVYTVLGDFSVEIIKDKGKNIKLNLIARERPFIYDSKKTYKPTVDELIRAGKIQEKQEEKIIEPMQNNEQPNSKENKTNLIQSFFGKSDSKEERGNSVINNQELLRLIDDLIEDKLNNKFSELNKKSNVIIDQNELLKIELGKLANDDEFANTNQKIDSLSQLVQKYPEPVTWNDLNPFLKPVLEDIPEAARNMDNKLQQLPRRIKSDFVSVAETNTSKIVSTVNKNSDRVYQMSHSLASSFSEIDSKLGHLPGKIGDTVTLHLEDTSKNISRLKSMMNETKETVEELQGKSSVLDDLKGKLDKVNFSQRLDPFNHEDGVVIELAEQGQLILEQLTLASRHYVAQSKEMEKLKAENEKLKQEHDQIEAMTTKKVEQMVKNEMTKQMILKFADTFANLDDLYTDSKLNGVQALLINHGFDRSEELKLGEQIYITDDNRNAYEATVTFEYDGEGFYFIEESQFVWKDSNQSIKKAKAVKVPEQKIVEETKNLNVEATDLNEETIEQIVEVEKLSMDENNTDISAADDIEVLLNNENIESAQLGEEQTTETKPESNNELEETEKNETPSAEHNEEVTNDEEKRENDEAKVEVESE